ncbi:M16 family metallopeptidase [Mangrovimonas aestuarii]|uniref:M16 family metallopeptidase n=1 Tax=Mangrovimonas aestuarii TaxID=3018443 RepID=UPI00237948FD|nr:pitrilysin family protein [Mangrovimonas aestuarii]
MKNRISVLIALFLMSVGVNAQIDRSKQPQPGPAPEINLDEPTQYELKNGMKILVVENHKLPRVSYSLTIDNKPALEGDKAGVASLLGSLLGNGTTSISKDDFNEEIDFLGARMGFGSSGGYAGSLSKYGERILELMADATINPLFTQEEFDKEKEMLIESLKSNEKSVDAIAGRLGLALSYGTQHPYGEFMTEETVNNITLDDVRAFYQQRFNPNNAYLVVVGDVKAKSVKKLAKKYFGKWKTDIDIDMTVPKANPNVASTQIDFIDMPNAVQSNVSLTNNVDLKMSDPDYHAVLIANKILGGGFNSYLNMNLREEHGYTYGARSGIGADKYASRFTAGASVRNMVTDSAVVQTLKEINRIKNEPVTAEALANAKAKYVGDFVLALEKPQTVARYALNIELEDLPEDFYSTYLDKINAVTIEDVQRVANKYFKPENARVIVVGKGSEILDNLIKTGIPVKYFDTYANPTEKPVFTKPIPEGVTASTVISKYVEVIGGETNLNKVNTILNNANVTIEGAPFKPTATIKSMAPNKSAMEMNIEGMGTIMKQKFDGTSGYTEQQGMKHPMSDDEVASKKAEKGLFPELYYENSNLTLESITAVEGTDAYKVKLTQGENTSYRYYDINTGLLIRTEVTKEVQGQSITSTEDFSDYKEVAGIKIPYTQKVTAGPQIITISSTEVKVNEGVSESDFQ